MSFIIIILSIALFAGIVSGLFGGGSGILFVPGFFFVLTHFYPNSEHQMQVAISTCFSASIPIGIIATIIQYKYKHIAINPLKKNIPFVIFGGLFGVFLMTIIPSEALKIYFSLILLVIACWMIKRMLKPDIHVLNLSNCIKNSLASLAGLFSMIAGVSAFFVPYFIKCGVPIKNAIGCSTVITLIMSILMAPVSIIAGLNAHYLPPNSIGYLNYSIFLITIAPSIIGAIIGSKLTHVLPAQILQIIYICMIFLVAGLMVINI